MGFLENIILEPADRIYLGKNNNISEVTDFFLEMSKLMLYKVLKKLTQTTSNYKATTMEQNYEI